MSPTLDVLLSSRNSTSDAYLPFSPFEPLLPGGPILPFTPGGPGCPILQYITSQWERGWARESHHFVNVSYRTSGSVSCTHVFPSSPFFLLFLSYDCFSLRIDIQVDCMNVTARFCCIIFGKAIPNLSST